MNREIFARNMKAERASRGWSQEGAAETIGIKRHTIAAYEEGRTYPSYQKQMSIRRVYEIDDWDKFISEEQKLQGTKS
jgi:transcriptional regulator with XRE-family HTH domain